MFRPAASTSVFDLDGVEILLHHQHQHYHHHHHHHQPGVFPGLYALENATFFSQDNGGLNLNGEPSSAALQPKPAAKKDRHSKINTSQGPRDRRVRLSIGIARKFFDLQELLGFDKPSKTLDWLLTKSKAAIRDLVQAKQKASSSPSEGELISSENGGDRQLAAAPSLAKQSRARARARARERTLEKMCIKQLSGAGSSISTNVKMSSGVCEVNIPDCPFRSEAESGNQIEESIVIKRKSKNPSLFGYQQNLVFSRELDSNYMIPSANANENWDVYGFASHSNLHAILDQHKFINRNSNI